MIAYDDSDLDIMARTIWGEARGEAREGRVAVAWVVRNRLLRPKRFGATIARICQQPYAFSCWNHGDPNRSKMLSLGETDTMFSECRQIALSVLNDEIADPTQAAQFYFNPDTAAPKWATGHKPVAVIGHHAFYAGIA
jgi:N-acetylmuramoyl-L-alanine amidase